MSVVNKKPHIEALLASLDGDQLEEIVTLLNTNVTHQQRSLFTEGKLIVDADKETPIRVDLELELGNVKSGILVYNDTHCTMIAYNRFQNVILYKLNLTKQTYEKLEEECSIEEFRRILSDLLLVAGEGVVTPEKILTNIEGSESIVVDMNESDDKVQISLDQDIMDFILPVEVALGDIEHDVGTTNTIITVAPDVLDKDNGYHIYLEIESTGAHYGADFTVYPYNEAVCLTTFNMVYNGETKECFGSLDSTGQLNIDIPVVMTPESQDTIIHYKRII